MRRSNLVRPRQRIRRLKSRSQSAVGHLAEGRIPGKFAIIWDLRVTGDNPAKVPPDARRASEKDLKAAGLELKAPNGLVPQITLPRSSSSPVEIRPWRAAFSLLGAQPQKGRRQHTRL